MKMSLRSLLKEYIVREALNKDDEVTASSSLDAQVDKLLNAYEAEAKNLKKEGYDFRMLTRRFLTEAGEDEEGDDAGGEEDAAGDEEGEEGGEEASPEEPKKLTSEDIDIVSFASAVSRLIDNYDQLLEVRDTLIKRSRDFLKKNYKEDVVSSFMSVLRDEYDIELGVTDVDKRFDINVPPAAGAGSSGGGGG